MLLKRIMPGGKMAVKDESQRPSLPAGDRAPRRELRTARGLTQAALAERWELHRTFVGSVERGERNVSILNLRVIARALRVPLTGLLAAEK
jgi:DNA-binding XRE family transcriptional regulator